MLEVHRVLKNMNCALKNHLIVIEYYRKNEDQGKNMLFVENMRRFLYYEYTFVIVDERSFDY